MKYFSFNRNHNDVLITLRVVIFWEVAYFFMYVPQNEKRVKEQRFRSLQNIDKNIHSKIDNSVALMNNLLTVYKDGQSNKQALTVTDGIAAIVVSLLMSLLFLLLLNTTLCSNRVPVRILKIHWPNKLQFLLKIK